MERKYLLYGLYDPLTNILKYIGITTQSLNSRLGGHCRQPTNFRMKKWIDRLKNLGLRPSKYINKIIKQKILDNG